MRDEWLQLAIAEGFGERPVPALLAPDVDPAALLRAPPAPPELPAAAAARLRSPDLAARAADLRARAAGAGLAILTRDAPGWPERLRHATLPPLVLFVRGHASALARVPAAAVVGSRTPTPYGADAAGQFAAALARAGTTLWSGLARGVDRIAHAACLAAGTPTVAVLAGGLDAIYPPEHRQLAEQLAGAGGCLVSELPPGCRARRGHFVRRNRILAAGTPAVLVIEASLASGALHTARFAAEAGADVFAVPGPWQSERSQGCHRLIGEGAVLAENPEALLQSLGLQPTQGAADARHLAASADEQRLLAVLARGPRPTDLLQRESGLDRTAFLRATFGLQRVGAVERLPGDLWRRTDGAGVTSR